MSEIVVYTALAVVFSRHDDAQQDAAADGDNTDAGGGHGAFSDAASGASIDAGSRRSSCNLQGHVEGGGVLWRPVADGAWTQLHLFLEMERDASRDGSPRHQLMRNFRLVAWVLETGKVIVNDVVCAKCMWAPIDELLWQFTSADGHCYGFRFHSVEQADECAQVVGGILNNVEEIRRLVKKMFETRTTTREFLALLYDIGFFKLDSSRRTTMIESAHAAVASLQTQPEWPRSRRGVQPLYPKEKVPEFTDAASRPGVDSRVAAAAADDPSEEETTIITRSTAKRSSNHHLLAQFTEVQKAALAATQAQVQQAESKVFEDSESDGDDSEEDSSDGTSKSKDVEAPPQQLIPTKRREEATSRSTVIDTSELSITACQEACLTGLSVPKDCISMPYKTRQELHVFYNNDFARYEGLPWAWRRLNHQFGLPLEAVPKRHVPGYSMKIPAVLQMLKELLLVNDGLQVEGIFRLAPDKDKCAEVKQAINDGTFTGCNDVHIIANLIKVWFRELPESLFNVIPQKHIYRTCELKDPQSIMSSIDMFPPLYASLVNWLLDLMAEVARNEGHNKMTARNLAIVISPNLFSITSDNPMYALTMSQKVAEFTFVLLDARLRQIR